MRLNRIKIAGFKSFVDPTSVHLPTNLTGVVGPNGCGKSNIIDAVRWVMGELSARYLRGDSMADVIFNGSGSRKPVGTASVELIFDNADGRVGGAYASYAEISLRRTVERDGTSSYFINGGRCRRRDITQLFLGTGLGSRSYAIIEQGTISRVVEARPEDMRAFIEEAAGISLYKERRRETESRIADTRENLARVADLREEVEKQIRHLARQANVARRYQELRSQERTLTAESLALRLRELDGTAAQHEQSMRERELAMQQALADQRASEAAIEKQREFYTELSTALSKVQAHYYEVGAAVTRTEQSLTHARQMRERAVQEQSQLGSQLTGIAEQIVRDEQQLIALRAELSELAPQLEQRRAEERAATEAQSSEESQLAAWQERWETFNRELGAATQSTEVEAARIEQLDNQRHRLQAHADRLTLEAQALSTQAADPALEGLAEREASGRQVAEQLAGELAAALDQLQQLRAAQQSVEGQLEQRRREREQARSELLSLEALQKAALREKHPGAAAWLASLGQSAGPRLAELLEVRSGWERAVETVLGDYLEAVGVKGLEQLQSELPRLPIGQLTFIEAPEAGSAGAVPAGTLATQAQGPAAALALLSRVHMAGGLGEALQRRAQLAQGESFITAAGEWVGRDWLRVNRGGDVHAGVIEREHRLKELRERSGAADRQVVQFEQQLSSLRSQVDGAEQQREHTQQRIQQAQREHADLQAHLSALRARLEQAAQRRARLEAEQAEVTADAARTAQSLSRARSAYEEAGEQLARLDEQRRELEAERELRRTDTAAARERARTAQLQLRDAMVRLESRRSAEASMATALARLQQRRTELAAQRSELEKRLRDADAPIEVLQAQLQEHLSHRLDAEAELASARRALEDGEQQLRALEQRRLAAEQRVLEARSGAEQVRLAVQESRLRREALLEQFVATQCELTAVLANLDPQAELAGWEQRLTALRADIERLGQVNLAAIGELSEQTERKSYLDRQFADVSEALETLETAMRKIDKETRSRFEDTFNRINAGLKEKFPTLFGGGHAYLELVGEDPLAAGVTVMARPPGKRNSTISQLSGGEKALTAVALVFAIFDLNPAPFCLLDEVDAPLDEHNVGRFCDIVRAMSSRIQFIFITHNKVTMELASQLVGVTMSEAGVSRLVSVDIDEAVKLAAV